MARRAKFKWNRANYNIFQDQLLVKALNTTAKDTLDDISDSRVVPFDTGHLQEESSIVKKATLRTKKAFLVWRARYATRLYYHPEFNFKNGRKGRWADEWIFGNKRASVLKTYEDVARRLLR